MDCNPLLRNLSLSGLLIAAILLFIIACKVLKVMVFAYVILSWMPRLKGSYIHEFLVSILGPVFKYVRKYTPRFGMLDLSPIFVFILIDLLQQVLVMVGRSVLG